MYIVFFKLMLNRYVEIVENNHSSSMLKYFVFFLVAHTGIFFAEVCNNSSL